MSDIFISYRREDSERIAKRIYAWLIGQFGNRSVFMDLSGIEPGENFQTAIHQGIESAQIVLAIIGKNWCTAANEDGSLRLDNPDDVLRQEISGAIDKGLRVVPLLVGGATMPRLTDLPPILASLNSLNAFEVADRSFEDDMVRLAEHIRRWALERGNYDYSRQVHRPQPGPKKVCLIGSTGVGKTSLVQRYVYSIFKKSYLTTLGVAISRKEIKLGSRTLPILLHDLAGEEEGFPVRDVHVRGSAGLIFVSDGRGASLTSALDLRERFSNLLGPVPTVLAVNKVDLYDSWQFTMKSLATATESLDLTTFTTSALTGKGVEEMFLHLAREMIGVQGDLD
jgi:small GTP-binding protein